MNKELLEYFSGDDLAAGVWLSKYAQEGEVTPDNMHKRMAREFGRMELLHSGGPCNAHDMEEAPLSEYGKEREFLSESKIYNYFKDFKHIIPQGSVMSQLGSKSIGSLSNCFVIGQPEDSYGGIFLKDEEMAQLMKRRGGVGIDISTLRPAGTSTTNAAKTSTGAVSFMHRFSNTTREVAQNGRRGALMISIDINHPDVMDFIKIKRDLSQVTGANISIKLNDEFMKAVEADEDYMLRFPCDLPQQEIDILLSQGLTFELNDLTTVKSITGNTGYFKRIKAKEYYDEIIKSAHGVAEPGLMYWDAMVNYSPDGIYPQFRQVTTNPCSEIGMQPYDACRLIVTNLFSFVKHPFTPEAYFDFNEFYKVNYEAMRLSDSLVDLELENINRILDKIKADPEGIEARRKELLLWEKVKATAMASRRTGLGFTALADTLAALGLKYDSDEALNMTENIMDWKMKSELDCTTDLAILRGPFEGWDPTLEFPREEIGGNEFYDFLLHKFPEEAYRMMKYGRRNVSWSTVAPTGSVSLLAQTTSGIEPLFMPFYIRRKKVNQGEDVRIDFTDQNGDTWQEFAVMHPKFKQWIQETSRANVYEDEMSAEDLQAWFEESPWYGSTANDIDWIKRVELQGVIQKYITHSISSTINLPNNVTEAEVAGIYLESWKKGLKGITVYRDGSRSGVLVSHDSNPSDSFEYKDAIKRPKTLDAEMHVVKVKDNKFTVVVGILDGKPYEVFGYDYVPEDGKSRLGKLSKKNRGDYYFDEHKISMEMSDEQAAITRLTSISLRHGADIKFVVEQLLKCDGDLFSFTKALSRVLKKYIPEGSKSTVKCNDCGSDNVIFEEGCNKCLDCGSSKCG
jgi:ribonucleoside-diphosphate reductase alpha chain